MPPRDPTMLLTPRTPNLACSSTKRWHHFFRQIHWHSRFHSCRAKRDYPGSPGQHPLAMDRVTVVLLPIRLKDRFQYGLLPAPEIGHSEPQRHLAQPKSLEVFPVAKQAAFRHRHKAPDVAEAHSIGAMENRLRLPDQSKELKTSFRFLSVHRASSNFAGAKSDRVAFRALAY